MTRKRYIVKYFTRDKGNTYVFHGRKRIEATTTKLKIGKDKTINISTDYPSTQEGLTSYFYVDLLQESVMYFEKSAKPILDAEVFDKIVEKQFFLEATSNLDEKTDKPPYLYIILSVIAGVFGGIVLGLFLAPTLSNVLLSLGSGV